MGPSSRPDIQPQPHPYRTQLIDHLGRVAGMFEELGITEVIAQATQQAPAMRVVTAGSAVKAMVLKGLGVVNPQLDLMPHVLQNQPTARLIAPALQASHLHDDTLGRTLDTLSAHGVTELYRLMAATAAKRLGLAPTCTPLDSTSFHVDGRYHRAEAADAEVVHMTQGDRREHRPDLNHVRWELSVEHQAGIPLLMKPLRGKSREAMEFGPTVSDHMAQLHTSDGSTSLVVARALDHAANLQKFAATQMTWMTRVPATWREAQTVLAQADPRAMAPLGEGYRARGVTSPDGGVAQRWVLIYCEQRQRQVQRTVGTPWLKHRDKAGKAFQPLCRTTFACEVDARQALARCAHDWQATFLHESTVCPTPRDGTRGRPGSGAPPDHVVYDIAGALASRVAARQALVAQPSCVILATNALDEAQLPAQAVLDGYKGQTQAERGFRFLKDPRLLASSLYLKKPERVMALLMVMTICWLVYAALEYRIRTALQDNGTTFPDQQGQRIQTPTARWVFHSFVGIHVLLLPAQGPIVINLTDEHQHLLPCLGGRYAWFDR